MSYQYHGTRDLIALPGRSVQTFPSGLVRVERSFMCRKGDVERYRNILRVNEPMPFDNGAPAIDGLYIFPEPQERVRDDGFVEFRVTAYGRTGFPDEYTIAFAEKNYFYARTVFQGTNPISVPVILNPRSLNETYTQKQVFPSSAGLQEVSSNPPKIDNPSIVTLGNEPRVLKTETFESNGLFIDRTVTYSIRFLSFSSTNYGRWNENVISWYAWATVFDKVLT
jgi:hypothetical protein